MITLEVTGLSHRNSATEVFRTDINERMTLETLCKRNNWGFSAYSSHTHKPRINGIKDFFSITCEEAAKTDTLLRYSGKVVLGFCCDILISPYRLYDLATQGRIGRLEDDPFYKHLDSLGVPSNILHSEVIKLKLIWKSFQEETGLQIPEVTHLAWKFGGLTHRDFVLTGTWEMTGQPVSQDFKDEFYNSRFQESSGTNKRNLGSQSMNPSLRLADK